MPPKNVVSFPTVNQPDLAVLHKFLSADVAADVTRVREMLREAKSAFDDDPAISQLIYCLEDINGHLIQGLIDSAELEEQVKSVLRSHTAHNAEKSNRDEDAWTVFKIRDDESARQRLRDEVLKAEESDKERGLFPISRVISNDTVRKKSGGNKFTREWFTKQLIPTFDDHYSVLGLEELEKGELPPQSRREARIRRIGQLHKYLGEVLLYARQLSDFERSLRDKVYPAQASSDDELTRDDLREMHRVVHSAFDFILRVPTLVSVYRDAYVCRNNDEAEWLRSVFVIIDNLNFPISALMSFFENKSYEDMLDDLGALKSIYSVYAFVRMTFNQASKSIQYNLQCALRADKILVLDKNDKIIDIPVMEFLIGIRDQQRDILRKNYDAVNKASSGNRGVTNGRSDPMSKEQDRHIGGKFNVAADDDKVGEVYAQLRELAGLTKVDFAAQVGVSESTLRQLETGRSSPSLKTLKKYADALGYNVNVELVPKGKG